MVKPPDSRAWDAPGAPEALRALKAKIAALDPASVDELYGLEPVYEPAGVESSAALGEYHEFLCPYCCENIGTSIDLTGGSRSYIEDCQVCCQPMEISVEIDAQGELAQFGAERSD